MAAIAPLQAIFVRLCLCLHFVLVVWRVTVSWGVQYWYLAAAIVPFLLEAVYTLIKRKGIEWKWFSPCFFFYMAATLPGIWLLEIHRTNTFQAANSTRLESIAISGLEIPVRLSADTWVLVVEELMLYLMILGRWVLPRGEVGREQLSQLLFAFIGIASDIMELFSLFDEDVIRHSNVITYALLGVWSWSIVQFCLTFHAAHRPRRSRGLRLAPPVKDPHLEVRHATIRVELVASILSLFMQDGPFLALRLYCMITYSLITYSLVFFTAKNVLVILLLLYKITVLCSKRFCPKEHDDDDDEEFGDELPEKKADDWEREEKERIAELEKKYRQNGRIDSRGFIMTDLQMVIEGPAKEAKKKGNVGVSGKIITPKNACEGSLARDKDKKETEANKKANKDKDKNESEANKVNKDSKAEEEEAKSRINKSSSIEETEANKSEDSGKARKYSKKNERRREVDSDLIVSADEGLYEEMETGNETYATGKKDKEDKETDRNTDVKNKSRDKQESEKDKVKNDRLQEDTKITKPSSSSEVFLAESTNILEVEDGSLHVTKPAGDVTEPVNQVQGDSRRKYSYDIQSSGIDTGFTSPLVKNEDSHPVPMSFENPGFTHETKPSNGPVSLVTSYNPELKSDFEKVFPQEAKKPYGTYFVNNVPSERGSAPSSPASSGRYMSVIHVKM